ncbi:hypothetical protein HK096_000594, partial [Nowakowskiella sp. JEL0078]
MNKDKDIAKLEKLIDNQRRGRSPFPRGPTEKAFKDFFDNPDFPYPESGSLRNCGTSSRRTTVSESEEDFEDQETPGSSTTSNARPRYQCTRSQTRGISKTRTTPIPSVPPTPQVTEMNPPNPPNTLASDLTKIVNAIETISNRLAVIENNNNINEFVPGTTPVPPRPNIPIPDISNFSRNRMWETASQDTADDILK